MNEYQDRLDMRTFRRRRHHRVMEECLLVATIFVTGMVCGWAITVVTTIK